MVWDLDKDSNQNDVKKYMREQGFDKNLHPKFKIGERIFFNTGSADHLRACATIKGLNGDDIYVYNDCYWFPIKDDDRRKIKLRSK